MSDEPFYRNNLVYFFLNPHSTFKPGGSPSSLPNRILPKSMKSAEEPDLSSSQKNGGVPCPAPALRPPAALLAPSRAADLPLLTPNRAAAAALTGGTTTPASSHRRGHLERLSPLRSIPLFAPPTRIAATPRPFHQIDSVLRGTWSSVFNQRQSPVLEGLNGKTQLY
jgi:hypothetical protein